MSVELLKYLYLFVLKRIAVLSLTCFYLLLTTGMFVCVMHCTAADLVKPTVKNCCHNMGKMGMACTTGPKAGNHQSKKNTKTGCCDKHGNYTVKENIKPPANVYHKVIVADAPLRFYYTGCKTQKIDKTCRLACGHSPPPPVSKKSRLVRLGTFLI